MATTVLNLNFGRKVNKIINQWLLRENATSQSHKTLYASLENPLAERRFTKN